MDTTRPCEGRGRGSTPLLRTYPLTWLSGIAPPCGRERKFPVICAMPRKRVGRFAPVVRVFARSKLRRGKPSRDGVVCANHMGGNRQVPYRRRLVSGKTRGRFGQTGYTKCPAEPKWSNQMDTVLSTRRLWVQIPSSALSNHSLQPEGARVRRVVAYVISATRGPCLYTWAL